MDKVQRTYAHIMGSHSDPLAGLDQRTRLAILTMPSTFRERCKLAFWKGETACRFAIRDIIAERRLALELLGETITPDVPKTVGLTKDDNQVPTANTSTALSPYYAYRLEAADPAFRLLYNRRLEQDADDHGRLTDRDAASELPAEIEKQLRAIKLERAKLVVKELELLQEAPTKNHPSEKPIARELQRKNRSRGRSM